jgi:hypothetical protein
VDEPDTRDVWDANAPVWIELTRAGFDIYRDLVNDSRVAPYFLLVRARQYEHEGEKRIA